MGSGAPGRILLTGATGFVGRALAPRLSAAGWQVRGLTRRPPRPAAQPRGIEWAMGDVARPVDVARALDGCAAAYYLVHGMGEGADFERRELDAAEGFARA